MNVDFRQIVSIGLLSIALSACSTSTGTINTPIGKIQIGMYIDDVESVLGNGTVVEAGQAEGEWVVQTKRYPSDDGRTYVVYYVNDIVRRWELKETASSASQSQ